MTELAMNEVGSVGAGPPKWFWVVSVLGLLWNLAGVAAFVGQMTIDPSSLPASERAFHQATPDWAVVAFAIAVSCGMLGAVALLFRRRWAFSIFVVSLLGVVVQISDSLVIRDGFEVFGPTGLIIPLLTLSIAIALAWFAHQSAAGGWLK